MKELVFKNEHIAAANTERRAKEKAVLEEEKKQKDTAPVVALSMGNDLNTASIGDARVVDLDGGVKLELCYCPPGSFTMGSPASEDGRSICELQVEVTLSQPFWLAKTELSQAEWEAVMGYNPSHFKAAQLPVESVSWEDAQSFIAKLNKKHILSEGWKFTLPTEAQWEYACRAEKGPYSGGSLEKVGWYADNSSDKTHEVGQKKPNAWGLHDMHGNVYEWCADGYTYTLQGGVDPKGSESGDLRLGRGGSWGSDATRCRAASRNWFSPDGRAASIGFRLALVPAK